MTDKINPAMPPIGSGKTINASTATPAQAARIDAMLSGGRSTDVVPEAPATHAETPVRDGYRRITYDVPLTMPAPDPLYDGFYKHIGYEAVTIERKLTELYAHGVALTETDVYNADTAIEDFDPLPAIKINHEITAIQSALSNAQTAIAALRRARMALAPYVTDATRKAY